MPIVVWACSVHHDIGWLCIAQFRNVVFDCCSVHTIDRATLVDMISRASVGSVSSARSSSFLSLYQVRPFSNLLNETFQFFLANVREIPPLMRKPMLLTLSVKLPL
jgi:hypothetical protein